jgi:hypothetical protein
MDLTYLLIVTRSGEAIDTSMLSQKSVSNFVNTEKWHHTHLTISCVLFSYKSFLLGILLLSASYRKASHSHSKDIGYQAHTSESRILDMS